MFGVTTSDDYRPVAWIGRYPLRVTSIICGLFVLGMFVTVICTTAGWDVSVFAFQPYQFLHGRLWQIVTYPLIQGPNFFFLFQVLFFYWSGNQVEQFLGVRRYLVLIALILVLPPLLLLPAAQAGVEGLGRGGYAGSYEFSIGMFIAFATLYPGLEVFGWVTLKWLAFAGFAIVSLQCVSQHDWNGFIVLAAMCLLAFGYIRYVQGRVPAVSLPKINPFRRKPRLHVVQKAKSRPRLADPDDVSATVDPILDKISKSGIGSLTDAERRQLDRARARLLKKPE